MKRSTHRYPPGSDRPLPPGAVYLVCREAGGDWVGDVLEAPPERPWWGATGLWRRYHVALIDTGCRAGHRHIRPSASEVAGKMAQARRQRTSKPLSVSPLR